MRQQLLVEQEQTQTLAALHHLSESGNLAGNLALALILLLEELAGQVVAQVVVLEHTVRSVVHILANLDHILNAGRDLHLFVQSRIQSVEAVRPGVVNGSDSWGLDQLAREQLELVRGATHQQVLDQLHGVVTLLGRVFKEHFREAGHVHSVTREVGAHRQVDVRGIYFHLDLVAHGRNAGRVHVDPVVAGVHQRRSAWEWTQNLRSVRFSS